MWQQLLVSLIMMVLSYALRPKPQSPSPATSGEADVPTAEEGRDIPVVFGRVLIRGPNVTAMGSLIAEPIKGGGKK